MKLPNFVLKGKRYDCRNELQKPLKIEVQCGGGAGKQLARDAGFFSLWSQAAKGALHKSGRKL